MKCSSSLVNTLLGCNGQCQLTILAAVRLDNVIQGCTEMHCPGPHDPDPSQTFARRAQDAFKPADAV